MKYILFFDKISMKDVALVGGKNASLGEMTQTLKKYKIPIPFGFAITSKAYEKFVQENNLDKKIKNLLKIKNVQTSGPKIRSLIQKAKMPKEIIKEIYLAYNMLCKKFKVKEIDVAIRSSATSEDIPTASFAGQLESFLNIKGKKEIISFVIKCYASLFTDRAISYTKEKKFDLSKIAISVGVQKMIRSDKASSGVIFTLDTETGFHNIITVTSIFGLGENIVKGKVIPDEFTVFKPFLNKKFYPILKKVKGSKEYKLIYSKKHTKNIKTSKIERNSFSISEKEAITLAILASIIEKHYKMAMDIEWAKDAIENKLYIVQARAETVKSKIKKQIFQNFKLKEKAKPILTGIAIGEEISCGKVQIIKSIKEIEKFKKGNILVTQNTTPDWVPIMKMAKGIITNFGGRTSHAAIVSRELGIAAIVATEKGDKILKNEQKITLDCSKANIGYIYNNYLKYESSTVDFSKFKKVKTPIMINISSAEAAFKWWQLPTSGIGLARMEFIITNAIQIHPMALINFHKIQDKETKDKINVLTKEYKNKKEYFVNILAQNIAKIAASQYPKTTIVRFSDFKTNEYEALLGGNYFEEKEDNPMIGFRGASRYYNERYRKAFELECLAIKKAREFYGFSNIYVMIPFCRSILEADKVLKILFQQGLKKSKTLKIYVMAEIPSNIILAEEFAKRFDGFSIGSNDLTQLILGVDRDSALLQKIFDPRNEAIKRAIQDLIKKAHKHKCKVGICGQAPSDDIEFARFLVKEKIDSISLNPDSVLKTIEKL